MKDLNRQIQLNIQSEKLFTGKSKVVLGISGGVDSITLANLLVRYFKNPRENLFLAHIDYKQRQNSADETRLIKKFAESNNLEFFTKTFDKKIEAGFENVARQFRYDFFKQIAQEKNADTVAVAHNADDQAETVLLKLIRGGDWTTFKGMQFKRDLSGLNLVRPLLNVSKKQIIEFAQEQKIKWVEDETNLDPDYAARNLIRNEVIPKLQDINQNASQNISDFASFIDDLENRRLPELLRIWLKDTAPSLPIKNSQIDDFVKLIENKKQPHGVIDLQDGFSLIKDNDEIKLNTPDSAKKQ